MTIPIVRLYMKPGCHLCDLAEELLDEVSSECPMSVEQIDIMTDVDLFERYRYEIPVVAVEGGGTIGGKITIEDLRRVLRLRPPRADAVALQPDPHSGLPETQSGN